MQEWTPEWLVEEFRNSDVGDDILFDVEEVPWAALRHAHGSADDVPALLLSLIHI